MGHICVQRDRTSIPVITHIESTILERKWTEESVELMGLVGSGSSAQVYLGRLKGLNEPVAVKVWRKAHVLKTKQVKHVFTEKMILRLIDSPFVVSFLGSFQSPTSLFCLLEYAPGGELFHLLCERDHFTRADAAFYAAEVTLALRALHRYQCVYRDLKPENVLISSTGHVKLADLGLAKVLQSHERTYTVCGTPEYISPELIEGSGCTEASDRWQLGVLMYEMMSGKTPFISSDPYRLYSNILTQSVEFQTAFDEHTQDLISHLLQKNPDKRITDSEIFKHAFFRDMDWSKVQKLTVSPPFVPSLASEFDSSYYRNVKSKWVETGSIDESLQYIFEGY